MLGVWLEDAASEEFHLDPVISDVVSLEPSPTTSTRAANRDSPSLPLMATKSARSMLETLEITEES